MIIKFGKNFCNCFEGVLNCPRLTERTVCVRKLSEMSHF